MSDFALCANGHELWVERDAEWKIVAVKQTGGTWWVFIDAAFCVRCGAEIVPAPPADNSSTSLDT